MYDPNIDKIIDQEVYFLRKIGCVVNIVDEDDAEEENAEELNILLKTI